MHDRLAGVRVAILFVGAVGSVRGDIADAIGTAGGTIVRERAIRVPVSEGLAEELDPPESSVAAVGRLLGREFVVGGETPAWDTLSDQLVLEQVGSFDDEVDAVVVARTASPQQGDTARFLRGLYEGLEGAVPAVGVEQAGTEPSFVERLRQFDDFSTVNDIDSRVGRVSLAVLLAGEPVGRHYGNDAPHGVMPVVEPVPTPAS